MGNHALHQKHSESVADEAKYCHIALLGKSLPQNSEDGEGVAGKRVAGSGTDAVGDGATAGDGGGI